VVHTRGRKRKQKRIRRRKDIAPDLHQGRAHGGDRNDAEEKIESLTSRLGGISKEGRVGAPSWGKGEKTRKRRSPNDCQRKKEKLRTGKSKRDEGSFQNM